MDIQSAKVNIGNDLLAISNKIPEKIFLKICVNYNERKDKEIRREESTVN